MLLKWLSKIITTGNYTDGKEFVNRKIEILFQLTIPVLWVYFLLCTDAAREAENADDAADNGKPGKTAGKGFVD